jgi:hypothetical protein
MSARNPQDFQKKRAGKFVFIDDEQATIKKGAAYC